MTVPTQSPHVWTCTRWLPSNYDQDDIDNDDDDEIQANMFEQVKGTTKATSWSRNLPKAVQVNSLVKFGTGGSFGELANSLGEIASSLWTTVWSIEITLSTFSVISSIENFNKSTSFVKTPINLSSFLFSRFFERHNQIFFSLINKFDFDWTHKPKLPEPSTIGNGDTWERLFWYDVFGKKISLHISLYIYLCIFMYKVVLLAPPGALYVPIC